MGDRKERVETGIYRRGDTFYVSVFAGRDPLTGKKRYRTATAATLAEARALRKRMLQEVEHAGHVPPQTMTFGQFLRTKFVPEHVAVLKPKTRKAYMNIIKNHLAPEDPDNPGLGKVRLDRLTRDHIVAYLQSKRHPACPRKRQGPGRPTAKVLSKRTLLHHYRVIHKALECAVQWGYIGRNVADQVTPPKPEKYRPMFLTVPQATTLLDYLKERGHWLYPLVATGLGTGACISEVLAPTGADVDMERRVLRMRQALAEESVKDGPVFGTTKSGEGRAVPMAEFVREALLDRSQQMAREKDFYAQDYQDFGLVFCRPDGRLHDPRNVSSDFGNILRKVNAAVREKAAQAGRPLAPEELLPKVRFHDLRHTCASFLLAQGVHPKVVQEILGHSTIQVTMDTYSHLLPGISPQAAKELDRLLRGGGQEAS